VRKTTFPRKLAGHAKRGVRGVVLLLSAVLIFSSGTDVAKAIYSFQANYNNGSYNAYYAAGSGVAYTDTAVPALANGYGGTNSLSYSYDGSSTIKYETAGNLSPNKGSIELWMQRDDFSPNNYAGYPRGFLSRPQSVFYDPASGYMYIADTGYNRLVKTKIDGTGWTAYGVSGNGQGQFYSPSGIAYVASTDYIYVADTFNNRVVKTKIDGTGWTVLGSLGSGVGQFNQPKGLAFDAASEFLYVADSGNNRLVKTKIDGSGWTTLGVGGSGEGQFNNPTGIGFKASTGFIYVSDSNNNRIVKTKIDGSGWEAYGALGAGVGQFNQLGQLSFDSALENIYLADTGNNRIVKTQIDGSNWTVLGSLKGPEGLFYDASGGYLYIAETGANRILKSLIDGTSQSSYGWGPLPGATWVNTPYQVAFDSASGYVFIADGGNHRVIKTKWDGGDWQTLGSYGSGAGQFNVVAGVAYDSSSGYVYVSDYNNNRLVKTKMDGSGWTVKTGFNRPQQLFYDPASEFIYVADSSNNRIVKTKIDGTGWTTLTGFSNPKGIFYDASTGYIYVGDAGNNRIVKTKIDGSGWTTLTGFNNPSGIFYDASTDYIYVADTNYNRIVKTKIDGSDWTTWGSSYCSVVGCFAGPWGIVYDPASQYFYISDTGNHRIVKSKWGNVGWQSYGSSGSGTGQFNSPQGVFYDPAGDYVYVSDTNNNRIVKTKMDGTGWTVKTGFSRPKGLSYDSSTGYIYVADYGNNRVVKTMIDGSGWATLGGFSNPAGLFYEPLSGMLYVPNMNWRRIIMSKFDGSNQTILDRWFVGPQGLALDPSSGDIYVTDTGKNRLVRTKIDGTGWATYGSYGSGTGQFNSPRGVYYDAASGYLLVADCNNNRLVKTMFDGTGWTTLGGFSNPAGPAYNPATGRIYVPNTGARNLIQTRIDGGGWLSRLDNDKVLFYEPTSGMKLVFNSTERKIRFYPRSDNSLLDPPFIETGSLNLTAGWHKIKATYNQATGRLQLYLEDQLIADKVLAASWGAPTLGNYFYIGSRDGLSTMPSRWHGMIDEINLTSLPVDTTNPTNPNSVKYYDSAAKNRAANPGGWANFNGPYIEFSGASDDNSGVSKYFLYFGTDSTADPVLTSGLLRSGGAPFLLLHSGDEAATQTLTVPSGQLTNGTSYYFIIRTVDADNNIADPVSYEYKFDNGVPLPPSHINISPAGCSTQNNFQFSWEAASDDYSGIAGYQYMLGTQGTVKDWQELTISLEPYQAGDNILYLRSKDAAGNISIWNMGVFCSTSLAQVVEGPEVSVGPSSITVSWSSSKPTTSYVKVFKNGVALPEQGITEFTYRHSVKVIGLDPEASYSYQLRWADEYGNLGESELFNATTATAPQISDLHVEVLEPTKVLVSWQSNYTISSTIEYGIGYYNDKVTIPGQGTSFSHILESLNPESNYSLRVTGETLDGYKFYAGSGFTTPPYPKVANIKFDYLPEAQASVKVSWTTNVPTTTQIQWEKEGSGDKKNLSDAEMVTEHSLTLNNLLDNTSYSVIISGRDKYNNTAVSDTQRYTTPYDTRPPVISNLKTEFKTVGTDDNSKAQIIVSWKTDEPATSQVEYGGGMTPIFDQRSVADRALTTDHVVILGELNTADIYHLRAISEDQSGNVGLSETRNVVTSQPQQSVLSLIVKSLTVSLGWLFRIIQ